MTKQKSSSRANVMEELVAITEESWLNPKDYDKTSCPTCGKPTMGKINNQNKYCLRCDAYGGDPDDYEPPNDTSRVVMHE